MSDSIEHYHQTTTNTIFGFWIYLMTDFLLFATLFAAYAVLRNSTFGGPTAHELLSLPYALAETLVLLTSSFTCALAMIALSHNHKRLMAALFAVTFLFGLAFLIMVGAEFHSLIREGHTWQSNAFLSSYFTLIATHALHIVFGLIFIIALVLQAWHRGLIPVVTRRLTCLSMFWFFSYVVWIFMYTIVYLIGAS